MEIVNVERKEREKKTTMTQQQPPIEIKFVTGKERQSQKQ